MIPKSGKLLSADLSMSEPSSYTFRLDKENRVVLGYTDNREAMEQAIYLTLGTERFQWAIFSWNYGVEFQDLFGMSISWVIPEVQRRITEALLVDSRIRAVEGFSFTVDKGVLTVRFTVETVFGGIPVEKEVAI